MPEAAISLVDQITCVRREINMRRRVYPRWVSLKRLKQEDADAEIARMEATLATLEGLRAGDGEGISSDGPHEIGDARRWLARQLLDSKLSTVKVYGVVAHHPAIKAAASQEAAPGAPEGWREALEPIIERLRKDGRGKSDAYKMIAEAKSARNKADDPEGGDYSWPSPEQTQEWRDADTLAALTSSSAKPVEEDAAFKGITRDLGVHGRKMTVGKHTAGNRAHLTALVAHLDAAGQTEAADTIIWLAWWSDLHSTTMSELAADRADFAQSNRRLREGLENVLEIANNGGEELPMQAAICQIARAALKDNGHGEDGGAS